MVTPTTSPPPVPDKLYGIFAGPIDQAAVQRVANNIALASQAKVKEVHLLFQSVGGGIGEGKFLYNVFRTLPFDLVLYNAGIVASIAVIAYLGAKKRKVSAHATFMIHRTQTTAMSANTETIKALAKAAILADETTESILRTHINLPDDRWSEFNYHDLHFSAKEAVEFGIADEIAEFAPPAGTQLFSI